MSSDNVPAFAHNFLPPETPSTSHLPKSIFPAFSSKQYNQLPTPQSPHGFASYIEPDTQRSPSNQRSFPTLLQSEGDHSKFTIDNNPSSSRILTPDSSPVNTPWDPRCDRDTLGTRPSSHIQDPLSSVSGPRPDRMDVPTPSASPISSRLSSPFAPRIPTVVSVSLQHRPPSPPGGALNTNVHSNSHSVVYNSIETHSTKSSPIDPITKVIPSAGGEIARIRQITIQNRIALLKDAEMRRPDYLKREKRVGPSANCNGTVPATESDVDKSTTIGITNSPTKGRRLKLFQETSEESFEESLMAGGYGRYRTAEWVRQPQPVALSATNVAGPSNIVTLLEQAQELPVSERELKKRKRLDAFQRDKRSDVQKHDLLPATLEGKGRVLIDTAYEARTTTDAEPSRLKKRNVGRKKRNKNGLVKEDQNRPAAKQVGQRPNWIDYEFPWRLRAEEIAGFQKIEEQNRLKLIEKYLNRDSDDDDDEDMDDALTSIHDPSYREGSRVQRTRGRGKMVPLAVGHPTAIGGPNVPHSSEKKMFPCDPADARIALLAKRSVRSLSYQLRRRQQNRSDEASVCICGGADDGCPLVQCDGCETWYHLQCIGIEDIAELGREEDPWFCYSCGNKSRASSSEAEENLSSEPTFVPTDEEPRVHRTYDTPFFQSSSPYNSPSWSFGRVPRTPTHRGSDLDPPALSSGSSWIHSSRHGPSTPQHPYGVRVYTQGVDNCGHPFEESPFDPTSTPSRGIKFGGTFMTPKNSVWSARPSCVPQTPSKPSGRQVLNRNGLAHFADDVSYKGGDCFSPLRRFSGLDGSPIRGSRSGEEYQARQILESPLATQTQRLPLLDESPIVRIKGKERL